MSPSYSVILMPEAIESLDEAFAFYRGRSPAGAARWIESFERAIASVEADPHRYPAAIESIELGRDLRQADFGVRPARPSHRLLFIVTERFVRVLTVRHHAQQRWTGS